MPDVLTVILVFGAVLLSAVLDTAVLRIAATRPMVGVWWYGSLSVLSTVLAAFLAAYGMWWQAAVLAFAAVVHGIRCRQFWNRRKRKRAAALAGAKSRARIAALVRKVRETGTPRRVLRPVPGKGV